MPSLAILPLSLPLLKPSPQSLSSFKTPIRMGGGPRTFPGGVSKWQWKRMQANKSKQLLKARLCRERQIYEMRKRAELKSAISQLEKPWEEVAQRAAVVFSVDEQIKALADRFQRPSGFDMWSEKDGPRIFAGNISRGFEKNGKEWRNQESYCSDSELVVYGSKIDGQFDRHGDNLGSYGLDSDLEVYGSKMNGDDMVRHWDSYGSQSESRMKSSYGSHSEMKKEEKDGEISKRSAHRNASVGGFNGSAGGYDRRGGRGGLGEIGNVSAGGFDRRGGRGGNQGSYRSDSELVRSGYRNESAGGFDQRGGRGGLGEIGNVSVGGFDRRGGRGGLGEIGNVSVGGFYRRGGRGGNQGSYRSDSELARSGYRNESAGGFDRHGSRRGNQGSYRSDSELARSGYRNASGGGFDRRGSRGGNRGSYRSDSELAHSGYRNASAGGFDRGGRGGNQGSYRSDSELPLSGYRNATGGFDRRGGRSENQGSYRSDSELARSGYRNASAGGFDGRGSGGGNRNCYGLELEIENSGFRKGRIQNTGGRERDYRDEGSVSLRPTTELRVEEGDARRVRKWSEGRNKGFRSSGTRRKD